MPITPAEARKISKDYVVKQKTIPPDAKVRVSDFGALAGGGFSVLVDVTPKTKGTTRYRVKLDGNGKALSLVTR